MADIKTVDVGTIKKGSYMMIDGAPCKVVDVQVSRPGKHGHAKFRIEAIGIIDEKKRDIVMPHGSVDVPIVEKKNAQVLSITGDMANVMDMETFVTFDIKIPEELRNKVKDGVTVLYWEIVNEKIVKEIKE